MIRRIAIALVVCLALTATAWALDFHFPPENARSHQYATRFIKSGELIASVKQKLTPTADGFVFEETGDNGKQGAERLTYSSSEVWRGQTQPTPVSYHYESQGAEQEIIDIQFRSQTEAAYSSVDKLAKKTDQRTIKVEPGTALTGATFFLMGSFPFEQGKDAALSFPVLMPEGDTYRVKITLEGEETVKVPAGAFECYKLKFGLKLTGIAKIAAAFVPDMYIWIEKAAPHRWIKFEGKEAGFTKPRTVSARTAP